MRHLLLVAALAAAVPLTPARAAGPVVTGVGCSASFTRDLTDPSGTRYLAEMDGGPIVLGDGRWGRLTCSIQREASRHSDPDVLRATSPTTPGVLYLAPATYSFPDDGWSTFWGCLEVEVEGAGTFYWTDGNTWSTDPDSECPHPMLPGHEPWQATVHDIERIFEPALCEVLAERFPPDGDVGDVWDCPPYEW